MQVEGQKLPNNTHPDVPRGVDARASVRKINYGSIAKNEAENLINDCYHSDKSENAEELPKNATKNHVDVSLSLDLVDFDAASVVSGTKFYYLKNALAILEIALVNWAMQKVTLKYNFTPLITPDLVRGNVLEKCGFQPRGANTQVYGVEGHDLFLTGTAEIPLGGLYMDKTVNEEDLPIKLAAYGHCFRTEAGAAGAATKGLYRVHQFSKVEMFVLCTPDQSDALHEELIAIEEEMFEELGLHFLTLDMPADDLGAPAYRKFDIEAWMPGLGRYGEISSASTCTDYQARRLNIRYRPARTDGAEKTGKKGKIPTQFVHTLNATACAVPRLLVCILENFQQDDGSIIIPEVLRPYTGGIDVIKANVPLKDCINTKPALSEVSHAHSSS